MGGSTDKGSAALRLRTGLQIPAPTCARLAEAKGAYDDQVASAHRLQADALEVDCQAKIRLAEPAAALCYRVLEDVTGEPEAHLAADLAHNNKILAHESKISGRSND